MVRKRVLFAVGRVSALVVIWWVVPAAADSGGGLLPETEFGAALPIPFYLLGRPIALTTVLGQ